MTQQPFSRPGAIDLSALKRPAAPAPGGAAGGASAGGDGAGGPYSVDLDEQNIQRHLEASMNAPVVLAGYSPSRDPESSRLADDLDVLADEFEAASCWARSTWTPPHSWRRRCRYRRCRWWRWSSRAG